jgi:putative transposase
MPRKKKYPDELLDRGARPVFESGRPVTRVAREPGVNSEILRRRVRRAEADTGKRKELLSSEDERLLARIREIHERNYCAYGYRRMWIALQREGEEVGRGLVQRLMREAVIQGAKRRGKARRTTKPDPLAHRRPDLVERDFSAEAPNRLRVGDFTCLRSREGSLFFSFAIDAFSRKVVGWQLASPMRTDLVLDALRMAPGRREPGADVALVARTDRGSRYTSPTTPGPSMTTVSSPPSARSVRPTTTRRPRASSTPSRPS